MRVAKLLHWLRERAYVIGIGALMVVLLVVYCVASIEVQPALARLDSIPVAGTPAIILDPLRFQGLLRALPTYDGEPWGATPELGTVAGKLLGEIQVVVIGCDVPHLVTTNVDPDRCDACGAVKRRGVWCAA